MRRVNNYDVSTYIGLLPSLRKPHNVTRLNSTRSACLGLQIHRTEQITLAWPGQDVLCCDFDLLNLGSGQDSELGSFSESGI